MATWLKIEDKLYDWPVVSFYLSAREVVNLRLEKVIGFDQDNPRQIDMEITALFNQTYPEYRGAVMLGYGSDPGNHRIFFTFAHRDFPRKVPHERPPTWHLLHRCACCKHPVEYDNDPGPTWAVVQPPGGKVITLMYCHACESVGFAQQHLNAAQQGKEPRYVQKMEFDIQEPRPFIVGMSGD